MERGAESGGRRLIPLNLVPSEPFVVIFLYMHDFHGSADELALARMVVMR